MAPPTILSTNSKPSPRGQWLDPDRADAELAMAARLLLVPALGARRAGDRLAVRDQHILGVDCDPELALELVERHRQVRLADPAQDGLVGLVVAANIERRVFVEQPGQRVRQLVVVALGPGRDRDSEQRLGELDGRNGDRRALRRQRVAGVVAGSFDTAAMSPATTSVTGSCSRPRSRKRPWSRSSVPERVLTSWSSVRIVPDSTLNWVT